MTWRDETPEPANRNRRPSSLPHHEGVGRRLRTRRCARRDAVPEVDAVDHLDVVHAIDHVVDLRLRRHRFQQQERRGAVPGGPGPPDAGTGRRLSRRAPGERADGLQLPVGAESGRHVPAGGTRTVRRGDHLRGVVVTSEGHDRQATRRDRHHHGGDGEDPPVGPAGPDRGRSGSRGDAALEVGEAGLQAGVLRCCGAQGVADPALGRGGRRGRGSAARPPRRAARPREIRERTVPGPGVEQRGDLVIGQVQVEPQDEGVALALRVGHRQRTG